MSNVLQSYRDKLVRNIEEVEADLQTALDEYGEGIIATMQRKRLRMCRFLLIDFDIYTHNQYKPNQE